MPHARLAELAPACHDPAPGVSVFAEDIMRADFSKTIPLLLLLVLVAAPAGGQAMRSPDCPLDPEFLALRDRCNAGGEDLAATTCAAVNLFELLALDQWQLAADALGQDFGYPEASRESVLGWLLLPAKSLLDPAGPPECLQAQPGPILALGEVASNPASEVVALMGHVFGWSEILLSQFEDKRLDPAIAKASKSLGEASRQVLLSTETGKMMLESLRTNPLAQMFCGQTPEPLPAPAAGGDEASRQIDLALRLAHEEGLEQAEEMIDRARSQATDPAHEAKLLARAGVGLLTGESNELALDYLRQADELLAEPGVGKTTATQTLRVLTRYFLALAYQEVGFVAQAASTAASAENLADGDLGEILMATGKSILRKDSQAAGVLTAELASGEVDRDQLKPLMEVLEALVPGLDFDLLNSLAGPSEGLTVDRACVEEIFRLLEFVDREAFDDAAKVAEGLIADFPSYNSVYLLSLIAAKQFMAEDHEGALRNSRKAVDALEAKVDTFRVAETQASFIDHKSYLIFRLALELAGQASQEEEAFDIAERGRAWTLRRLLGGSRNGTGRNGPSNEESKTLAEVRTLEGRLRSAPPEREGTLEHELKAKRRAFADLRLARKLERAGEQPLTTVGSVTLDRLRTEVLPPDTTLLVYAEGPGDLWAWVIDRESVEMFLLPALENTRVTEVTNAVRGVSQRGARPLANPSDDSLEALYSHLIAPVTEHLDQESLIVVPHGVLHHLPFAALRDPETEKYPVERFTLSLAPSALEQILLSGKVLEGGEPLVLGEPAVESEAELPDLPGASREAMAVAELLGTEPLLGERATKTAVLRRAENVGLLHLAAHGEFTASDPIFSWVRLASDDRHHGLVEMHEVWDYWALPRARLVTLSGCQTALGELTRGDEVLGLTQAFLVAGSRSVLSTLWSVADQPSEQLMVLFYRRLLAGETAASALRQAQLGLMEKLDDPYYWAGYTLTGDPRTVWQAAPPPADADVTTQSNADATTQDNREGETPIVIERAPEPRRWPKMLAPVLGLLLAGVVALGFLLPPPFPPRLGVFLSSEEDLEEGYFHPIPSARRFLRPARIYVAAGRLLSRPSGALARLQASSRGVRLKPLHGQTLWRQSLDGEWQPAPSSEHRVHAGIPYRDQSGTVFFELRRG